MTAKHPTTKRLNAARKHGNLSEANAYKEGRTFAAAMPKYLEYIRELVSHNTACDMLGLDHAKFKAWVDRLANRRDAAKRARAEGVIEAHREAVKGAQGWQAKFRILESADDGYSKAGPGRNANDASPYSAAMGKRRGK